MSAPESENDGGAKSRDLLTASLPKSVLSMAVPMLIGMLAMVSVDVVDAFFVGQLGDEPLAALSFCFPVLFFVTGVSSGLGAGVQAVVARAFGEGDAAEAGRITTQSLVLAVVTMTVLIAAGFLGMRPLFSLLGATDSTFPVIESFMSIWFPSAMFIVLPYVGGAALMAGGDATTPAIFMVGAAVLNAILDPLLIFGLGPFPELGVAGAAAGSAIARGSITVFAIVVLLRRGLLRRPDAAMFSTMFDSWARVGRVGGSIMLINFINPLTLAFVTRLTSEYGDPAVAAIGAGTRIQALAMLVPSALAYGMMAVVGQNWGAKLYDRVDQTLSFAEKVAMGWSVLAWLALAAASSLVAGAFVEGAEAVEHLRVFLLVFPLGAVGLGLLFACNTTMNSIEQTTPPIMLTVTRGFFLIIPFAWIGSELFGVVGIFAGFAAADVVAGILSHVVARRVLRGAREQEMREAELAQ